MLGVCQLMRKGNDRYSGDRYSGIDRFSGTKTSDDDAILFTANDYFSGNDCYSGTKTPDRFFHYNGCCLYTPILSAIRVLPHSKSSKVGHF